ncbi:MAG: cobalamin-binding protein, partial [Smithellaceae bacterium]|nr:cobalamin-binding protein [Smithellaceae bacterium]
SIEEVVARQPEVIICSSMEDRGDLARTKALWGKWPQIPAVRDGRIYRIEPDIITRSSPRIVDAVEIMARMLHPEIGNIITPR